MKTTIENTKQSLAFLNLMPHSIKDVHNYALEQYNEGFSDGIKEQIGEIEIPDIDLEKIGVNFAVKAFEECANYSEFREKLVELQRLQLNHEQPMPGQYLLFKNLKN